MKSPIHISCRDGEKLWNRFQVTTMCLWIPCLVAGVWWPPLLLMSVILAAVPFVYLKHSDSLWMLRILAWLDRDAMLVEAWGVSKCHYYSLAYQHPDGSLQAAVYHSSNLGKMCLLPNGTIDPQSDASFMYMWLPLDPDLRAELLLMYDFPVDLGQLSKMSDLDYEETIRNVRGI